MRKIRKPSPIRAALQMLWDVNIKAIPTAVLWSISFWLVIETHSLLTRILAILVASFAAFTSGVILIIASKSKPSPSWKVQLSDSLSWKLLLSTGMVLALALENVWRIHRLTLFGKFFYLSMFVSSLILWLFVCVVLVPIRIHMQRENNLRLFEVGILYVWRRLPYLALSLATLLFGWPLLFAYAFVGLTFSQCLTLSSIMNDIRDLDSSKEMGEDFA
jgi:hypothetical protein